MVTTGVGRDIEPEEDIETVFTIIAIVVGVLMYAFIVGKYNLCQDIALQGRWQ